ncbi:MAG: ABC-type transport auxiliary lipoprotein family protein [Erythrobacter sp.]|uniref:ABC-type transport auxiliary lipoprotein family protein n=1 Tax=Erythrobacter sp. TaxID=1042 RepID=UPI0032994118
MMKIPTPLANVRTSIVLAGSLVLAGCVSLGGSGEPPESLLTLTPSASAPVGSGVVSGIEGSAGSIAVLTPEVPAKLDVLRVPVNVSNNEVAYLQDTVWIQKPARLFRSLLGETLRTASGDTQALLVLDTSDTPLRPTQTLRGTLIDMGYEPSSSSVVVRFEAVHTLDDGRVKSRRFEAREEGVLADAAEVGPALNAAANAVAKDVAAWVLAAE